jgi:hypothetical protein
MACNESFKPDEPSRIIIPNIIHMKIPSALWNIFASALQLATPFPNLLASTRVGSTS